MEQERKSTIKDMLEQYTAAKTEMQMIDMELHSYRTVTDSVKGSMVDHPYILHSIPVIGIDLDVKDLLQARKAKLARLRLEVERFLSGVDSRIGVLIRARYIDQKTWNEVALESGDPDATEDSARKMVERFFEKFP